MKQLYRGRGPPREKWRLGSQWDRGSIHRNRELGVCQAVAVTDERETGRETRKGEFQGENSERLSYWIEALINLGGLLVLSQVVLAYQKSD